MLVPVEFHSAPLHLLMPIRRLPTFQEACQKLTASWGR